MSTYVNYDCRCAECKAVASEYNKKRRAARISEGLPEGDPRHGVYSSYFNYGCRCELCKRAASDYQRQAKAKRKAKFADQLVLKSGFSD